MLSAKRCSPSSDALAVEHAEPNNTELFNTLEGVLAEVTENLKEADVCELRAEMVWLFAEESAWVVDQSDSTPVAYVVIHQEHKVHFGGACYHFAQLFGNMTCITDSSWLTFFHQKHINVMVWMIHNFGILQAFLVPKDNNLDVVFVFWNGVTEVKEGCFCSPTARDNDRWKF